MTGPELDALIQDLRDWRKRLLEWSWANAASEEGYNRVLLERLRVLFLSHRGLFTADRIIAIKEAKKERIACNWVFLEQLRDFGHTTPLDELRVPEFGGEMPDWTP